MEGQDPPNSPQSAHGSTARYSRGTSDRASESVVPSSSQHDQPNGPATPVTRPTRRLKKKYKTILRCIGILLLIIFLVLGFWTQFRATDEKMVSRKLFEVYCYGPSISECGSQPMVIAEKYKEKICNVSNKETFCNNHTSHVFQDYDSELTRESDKCAIEGLFKTFEESQELEAVFIPHTVFNDRLAISWRNLQSKDDRNPQEVLNARPCQEQRNLDRECYNAQFFVYKHFCLLNASDASDSSDVSVTFFTLAFMILGIMINRMGAPWANRLMFLFFTVVTLLAGIVIGFALALMDEKLKLWIVEKVLFALLVALVPSLLAVWDKCGEFLEETYPELFEADVPE